MSKYKVNDKYTFNNGESGEPKLGKKYRRKSSTKGDLHLSLRGRSLSLGALTSPQLTVVEISESIRSPKTPPGAGAAQTFDMEELKPFHLASKGIFLVNENMYGYKVGEVVILLILLIVIGLSLKVDLLHCVGDRELCKECRKVFEEKEGSDVLKQILTLLSNCIYTCFLVILDGKYSILWLIRLVIVVSMQQNVYKTVITKSIMVDFCLIGHAPCCDILMNFRLSCDRLYSILTQNVIRH